MKLLTQIVVIAAMASGAIAEAQQEFIGESEARVVKSLSNLPAAVRGSYDPAAEVTKENASAVTQAQNQILEHLIEALAVLKSRKGDLDLESHRKEIKRYRDSVSDFWRYETKSLIQEEHTALPSLRLDTFLVRHLAVRLLCELRTFQEEAGDAAGKVSVVASEIHREVNAALVWLGPVVDTSFGPPSKLPESLIGGQSAPADGEQPAK